MLKDKTELTSWDYKKVLAHCTSDDIVYMDPPYQGVCNGRDNRYLPKVDHHALCDELSKLNERGVMFAVSYDGRTGSRSYGTSLPNSLDLEQMEIRVGRSAQSTLLGRSEVTFESLYLSSALRERAESSGAADVVQAALL